MARSPTQSGRRPAKRRSSGGEYAITLRTGRIDGPPGASLTFRTTDKRVYPHTVAWNEWLVAARLRGRAGDRGTVAATAGDFSNAAAKVLESIGVGSADTVRSFLAAALDDGIIQVELAWAGEGSGYAARLFPWEQTLLLAARNERRLRDRGFVVIRWLARPGGASRPATGPALVVTTRDAHDAPFGIDTEADVVRRSLALASIPVEPARSVSPLIVGSADELRHRIAHVKPRLIHFMLRSVHQGIVFSADDLAMIEAERRPDGLTDRGPESDAKPAAATTLTGNERLAGILGGGRPAMVSLSSCYTGRRLAPLALAAGADLVVAFHQEVEDENTPAFFGTLYKRWAESRDPVVALCDALAFNREQPDHDGLGAVTLWSATDQLAGRGEARDRTKAPEHAPAPAESSSPPRPTDRSPRLIFDCVPEPALNYSILHNSRGGLFKRFIVTALDTPAVEPLTVTVQLDTGSARPSECHFTCAAPTAAYGRVDLARLVHLPLGAELLRQRRETTRATVEVAVDQGEVRLFHETRRIEVLPADEWCDDRSGNHFLPSFIFPRDQAVREIISAAYPFLRAIGDRCDIAFDGYQEATADGPGKGIDCQIRAIWSALQHGYKIDYANPPPAYLKGSQRIRTPSEILRARRATCIEISLLLAACWEHIGIEPLVFLTRGHAFCGYWTGEQARRGFLDRLVFDGIQVAGSDGDTPPASTSIGGTVSNRDVDQAWLFAEVHLRGIVSAVANGGLVPVEATGITQRRSFRESCDEARTMLSQIGRSDFDGMFDVRSARDRGVTPLPIILDGPAS